MSRKEISKLMERKLNKWFAMTLDTNNDGLVNWTDFQGAIEVFCYLNLIIFVTL